MAALNLIPNPELIAIQAGIFLANVVVVKKLMIDPYVKLRDQRYAQTKGGQEEADKALRQSEEKAKQISERLGGAYDYAKAARSDSKGKAEHRQEEAIAAARQHAKETLDRLRVDMAAAIALEKKKVPEVVAQLTTQFYGQVVH